MQNRDLLSALLLVDFALIGVCYLALALALVFPASGLFSKSTKESEKSGNKETKAAEQFMHLHLGRAVFDEIERNAAFARRLLAGLAGAAAPELAAAVPIHCPFDHDGDAAVDLGRQRDVREGERGIGFHALAIHPDSGSIGLRKFACLQIR